MFQDSPDREAVSIPQSTHVSESECAFAHSPIGTEINLERSWGDEMEEEAYNVLKVAANCLTSTDDFSIFGQMVASQLRKLNQRNQAIAKNYIQNYLFDMEMREINSVPLYNLSSTLSQSVTPSAS
jgi:hypothetical protein